MPFDPTQPPAELAFWDWDISGDRRTWINRWREQADLTEFSGAAHERLWTARMHPDDLPAYQNALERHLQGLSAAFDVDYRLRGRKNGWVRIHEHGRIIERDGGGRALRMVGFCLGADERRATAQALDRTQARIDLAMRGADFGFWEIDVLADEIHWWNAWCAKFDIDPCVGAGHAKLWDSHIHPDDLPLVASYDELIAGRCELFEAEYRVRTRSGAWRWLLSRGRPTQHDSGGRVTRITGVTVDIDARRRAEQLLLTQSRILETMREGVILVDAAGRIEYTNPAFDRIFGWQAAELDGTSILALLNVRPRSRGHPIAIERLLRRFNARTSQLHVWLQRRDQSQFAAEVLSARIDQSGTEKILFVVQDVSERKRLEQEIIDAGSRERRRLGSDLHDGLGQELTGISLLLRSFARQLSGKDGTLLPQLDEIIGLVNHAINATRTLALGLSPTTPARDGFVASLSSLASWSRAHFGIDVELRVAVPPDLNIDEVTATHLYLIAQEAILNAVKHGAAQAIVVGLRAANQMVRLSISDDGSGLPKQRSGAAGMGLKIIEYRAGMIGGSAQIKNRKNGGARVRCIFPMETRKAAARARPRLPAQVQKNA